MKVKVLMTIFTSVILSAMMFSIGASAIHPEEDVFSDVDSGDENYTAIMYLKDATVVVGYDDGTYKPEAEINRAEFLKIVMEAYGHDTEGLGNCFTDVTDQWFAPYVCKAKEMGIVSGYSDGYYKPDRDINFAEASKIVAEAFRLTADVSDPDNWYHQYVISLELLAAIPTSVDSFSKNITRGEMAEIVYRIKAEKTTLTSNTYVSIVEGGDVDDSGDVTSITLTGNDNGDVSWSDDGYSASGYKVVWSMNEGPTYPTRTGDKYKYHSDPSTTSSSVYAFDGEGVYYVRVCEYLGGECGVYSNQIQLELTEDPIVAGDVNSITLVDDADGAVSWTVDGTSESGFKVVWGMTTGPTYPTRTGDQYLYYSDPGKSSATVDAFDGDGTYYVRVCEYLGGACGVYSNEIEVALAGSSVGGDVTSLTLSDDGDETVSWVAEGTSDSGYKVVWSMTSGPEYPTRAGDEYLYYADSLAIESGELDAFDGDGTYYVRVCEYLGGSCGLYSNEIEVALTGSTASVVTSLTLSDDGDGTVSWVVDGSSDDGYKVVWSLTSGPEYPLRDAGDQYLYYSDPAATESAALDAFDGAGTYYVRACEYTGGACGVYSNELEVAL